MLSLLPGSVLVPLNHTLSPRTVGVLPLFILLREFCLEGRSHSDAHESGIRCNSRCGWQRGGRWSPPPRSSLATH